MNGLQVFRRHDVLVIHFQFNVTFLILYRIRTTAYLHASSAIGRSIQLVQAQITLSGNGHTQSSVAEHFDTHQLTHRTLDLLLLNSIVNLTYLFQVQFTRQYHHIGKA